MTDEETTGGGCQVEIDTNESEYAQLRAFNIARNVKVLKTLGLDTPLVGKNVQGRGGVSGLKKKRLPRDHQRFTRAWGQTPSQSARLRHKESVIKKERTMVWRRVQVSDNLTAQEWDYSTTRCKNKYCACYDNNQTLLLPTKAEWIARIRIRVKWEEYRLPEYSQRLSSLLFHRNTDGTYNKLMARKYSNLELRAGQCARKRLPSGGLLVMEWGGIRRVERRSTITYVDGSSTIITNKHVPINLNVRIVKSK